MGRLCFRTELNFLLLMQFLSGAEWRTFCLPIAIGTGTYFIEHYACRGTNYLGARKLSRCRILIACRCALCPPKRSEGGCPGAYTITKLSWEQEHLPAGRQESKNRDKQLTHIVRVISRLFKVQQFIHYLVRHVVSVSVMLKLIIWNNQFFGRGRFIFLTMLRNRGLLNNGSRLNILVAM